MTYKGKNTNSTLQKCGRHHFSQVIKGDNRSKEICRHHIAPDKVHQEPPVISVAFLSKCKSSTKS